MVNVEARVAVWCPPQPLFILFLGGGGKVSLYELGAHWPVSTNALLEFQVCPDMPDFKHWCWVSELRSPTFVEGTEPPPQCLFDFASQSIALFCSR